MPEGSLTRHFGMSLVTSLADRITSSLPEFDIAPFLKASTGISDLALMDRVHTIADALAHALPSSAETAWRIQERILGPPLRADQQTFNDGYWMLPLADYWARHQLDSFQTAMTAIAGLTRRGTSEFAIRPFFQKYPEAMKGVLKRWTVSTCFHVRRLASEGSRPYLPWGGRLRVAEKFSREYLEIISVLKTDPSPYVRRSVGNHVRDWRRINPYIADKWIVDNDPPKDLLEHALPRTK